MGGLFDSWFKPADENAQANGSEIESNVAPTGLRLETSESAKIIADAASGRKQKPKSAGGTFTLESGNAGKDQSAENAAKILDAILDPKVWRGAVAAPGDMMYVVTSKEHWLLSEDERDTLAKTGAATARAFAVTDPKWLALSLFAFSVLSIYGGRIMKDISDKKAEKKNTPITGVTNVS